MNMFADKPKRAVPEHRTGKKAGLEKKAVRAFEKFEEEAMYIEDRGNINEVEDLYRKARDAYGVNEEIRSRCNAELERLRGVRRR